MLQLKNIRKAYKTDDFTQVALDDVSVAFRDSEFVAILGPSGSGKTTMLNVLGGLDRADSGEIVINGVSTKDYSSKDWDTYRNHRVGFVFQSYNLIPHQTVLSNVELALTLAGVGRAERRRRATEALAAVGLADHVRKRPAQLSGGQMQRVAIARALVNDPDIVLADEPTGALDTDTGIQVMNILRDVARDRLVVMVTHNPDLAESYATRIVRVRDGRIVDDSDPILAGEPEAASFSPAGDAAQAPLSAGRTGEKDKGGRASMGFLTALSLSFNNLMTKKGRTFMTAFAGSIGIIGIAAILALSNGVNHYIARTEEGALSSYPLTITKSSFDFSKLMGYGMSDSGTGTSKGNGARRAKGSDDIPQRAIVTDMFAQVKSNDLGSFKKYLDAHRKKVARCANAVEYDYDVTPQIYMADTSKGVTRLNPSSVASTMQGGVMGSALTGGSSSTGTFTQLVSDERLLRSNMSLVRGAWPKAADEAVLVLNRKGEVSDYTLYGIGFYDPQSMQKMTDEALGGQKVEVSRKDRRDFTYDDALGMTFAVVPSANLYQRNDAQGTWTDMSEDEAYMRRQVQDGIKLKIVGVIRPKGDAQSGLVKEGVAYTPALTQELMRRAASSQIVREQQARRDVDVFTGKTFEELRQSQESFDMRKMFTVDQDALKRAFTIDTSAVTAAAGGLDSSALDLSGVSLDQAGFDPSAMTLDTSALDNVLSADTVQGILRGIEPFSAYAEKNGLTLTDEQNQAVDKASTALVTGYLTWRQGVAEGADSSWDAYSQTPEAQGVLSQLRADLGDDAFASASALYQQYMGYVGDYVKGQVDALVQQAAQVMATQLASQMSQQVSAATQSLGTQLSAAISQQVAGRMAALSGALQNGFSVDPEAFASAIHLNMTADDLRSLLNNYASADKLTYDSNMQKLGFADASSPESISIYPKDFAAKESLLKVIDEYNDAKAAKGQDGQKIQYSDVAGSLMSSVTDIVNMISMVLIAFVSISLVVSSIMIGIITYISVLERKKEIGVLRAMGASKLNVANVFNAETVIEGLIAGVLAIAVVLIVQVPVNHAVLAWKGIPDIMMLPWTGALALIGISVLLTFLGGLIPSTKASRNDPVESLRSE
ncbi:ABC transporter ATP-binding protein/permease [Parafannyhessea umbonata]|uniref:ABC-type lipoprotein export system, ATPase component n=1 Tax=Parafannyhessea umbonata TaxID=604330 RepID=A0A1G6HRG2_9ACTN|nr:ABC transporter ATP-binding protein/permease [Parafannyhessea umbonata]SDB96455.1 ABC-type lipoprotein export system, ATPase component [Parafannyhessea umbonata]